MSGLDPDTAAENVAEGVAILDKVLVTIDEPVAVPTALTDALEVCEAELVVLPVRVAPLLAVSAEVDVPVAALVEEPDTELELEEAGVPLELLLLESDDDPVGLGVDVAAALSLDVPLCVAAPL